MAYVPARGDAVWVKFKSQGREPDMMTFWVVFYGLVAFLLLLTCLRGLGQIVKAAQARDRQRLKALAWTEFRVALNAAGAAIIAATQGRGVKVALVLLIISMATRAPKDFRVLRQ